MTLQNILPLESKLKALSENKASFPRMDCDYFTQYEALVNALRVEVYPQIDTGLTIHSGVDQNTNSPGYYTFHSKDHFDEVVRKAGELLNVESWSDQAKPPLDPYELYVLLIAIRIHDIGNITGRKGHEAKCYQMLRKYSTVLCSDNVEMRMMANIAQAHGGRCPNGTKDTISQLPIKAGSRQQLLAGIVRFADEIAENRNRARKLTVGEGIPHQSQLYHAYANSISEIKFSPSEGRLSILYCLEKPELKIKYGCERRNKKDGEAQDWEFLVDEIYNRLEKMNQERIYCNRFMRELVHIRSIDSAIEIYEAEDDLCLCEKITIPVLQDVGYPDNCMQLDAHRQQHSGAAVENRYFQQLSLGGDNGARA